MSELTLEKIEKLKNKFQYHRDIMDSAKGTRLNEILSHLVILRYDDLSDLLAILDEKAEQIKAANVVYTSACPNCGMLTERRGRVSAQVIEQIKAGGSGTASEQSRLGSTPSAESPGLSPEARYDEEGHSNEDKPAPHPKPATDEERLEMLHWVESWRQICRQTGGGCATCELTVGGATKKVCDEFFNRLRSLILSPPITDEERGKLREAVCAWFFEWASNGPADLDLKPHQERLDKICALILSPPAKVTRDFPAIVCLCGSTRFMDAFFDAGWAETLAGRIVLSVGVCKHAKDHGGEALGMEVVELLDELHKRKIDLADQVFILNVGGYVGDSTKSEIRYAIEHCKIIRWLEPESKDDILRELGIPVEGPEGESDD